MGSEVALAQRGVWEVKEEERELVGTHVTGQQR